MATLANPVDSTDPTVANRLYLAPTSSGAGTPFSPSGTSTLADVQANAGNYTDAFTPGGSGGGAAPKTTPSVLSTLPEDLANQYTQTLKSMMSGQSYAPNLAQNNEGFVRAANELRAKSAAQSVGAAGQGGAIANQNATENTILGMASQNDLNNQVATEQVKQAGVGAANTLAGMETQSQQFGVSSGQGQQQINLATLQNTQTQGWATYDKAVEAGDFATAAAAYKQATGKDLDTSQFKTVQDYRNVKMNQDVTTGDLTIQGMQDKLGSDKYNAIQNMVNTGATVDQINGQYGAGTLSADQYNSMKSVAATTIQTQQFAQTIGLDTAKLAETAKEFGISTDQAATQFQATLAKSYADLNQQDKQFVASLGLDQAKFEESKSEYSQSLNFQYGQLAQNATLTREGIASGEKIAGMNISSNQTIAQMQITSAQKIAADSNWLTQQGIDLNKASVEGYPDQNGQHVQGSAEIAAGELGLKATTVADAHTQLFGGVDASGIFRPGTMANMDAETQQKAAALFGTTDANGNHIPGSLEIQNDQVAIQKQGLSLQDAALKGYIDSDGNYVKGSAQIEAEKAGATIDSLKGYRDPNTGEYIDGSLQLAAKQFGLQSDTLAMQKDEIQQKYSLLNAEDQRAADALYGKDVVAADGTTVHMPGTMDLQANEQEIQKQGMTLQEAGMKGYTDDNGNHVAGSLEIASSQLDLAGKTYQDQHNELFGYYDNSTGAYVPGKIDSMNAADKNAAYALYGNPDTGVQGSLQLQNEQVNGELDNQRTQIANTYDIQNRATNIQEASAESAQYWDASKKLETYASTHLDANPTTDAGAQQVMSDWWKAQTGTDPSSNPAGFAAFTKSEWSAATDKRLVNPIDASIYAINSSTQLDDTSKAQMVAMLKDAGPGVSFTQNKDGTLSVSHTDANGNVVTPNFKPDFTINTLDYASGAPAYAFASNGQFNYNGKGNFQPLATGQNIAIQGNAMIQGSQVSIPAGNYKVLDATHIQAVTPDASGNYLTYDTTGKTSAPTKTGTNGARSW